MPSPRLRWLPLAPHRTAVTLLRSAPEPAAWMGLLNGLIARATEPQTAAQVVVQVGAASTTTAPAAAPTASPGESYEQITKLAELHRAGILSDAEFAAAKAKALGI